MPLTLIQRTAGGGGYHFLFNAPDGVDIKTGTNILPGVDIRGGGKGYIVIPPSINPYTNRAYEWLDENAPIADPPRCLVDLVLTKGKEKHVQNVKAPQTAPQSVYTGTDGGTPYGLAAKREEVAKLRNATEGTRNDTLNRVAFSLYSLCAGGELDEASVTAELEASADSIGLDSREVMATLKSARDAGYASPRQAPKADMHGAEGKMESTIPDEPMPLRRPPQEQAPYPVKSFLEFAPTLQDIATSTDTHPSMVGGAMLATMSLLAQRLVNVKTPKHVTPLSLYSLIVAESGDGKSMVEGILTKRLREKEKGLLQKYRNDLERYELEQRAYNHEVTQLERKKVPREARQEEMIELLKTKPRAPVYPVFMIGDLNIEGLFKNFKEGLPYIGVFSDEAGRLFGGTAFSKENRLKTIANLASIWSGGPLDKMRSGEGVSKLYDRRLCANLMIQPEVAKQLFVDNLLEGQGFLYRQLIAWPSSMTKRPEQIDTEHLPSVQFFYRKCEALLELPDRRDDNGGLIFDDLELSPESLEAYKTFYTHIEEHRTNDGIYVPVNGYAKRAAEQALRIAGCLSMMREPACRVIPLEVMEAGIKLAEWYLDEVLRITLDDMASPEVLQAEKLLDWLHRNGYRITAVKQILQYGPNKLREKKKIMQIIALLQDHGWLVPIPGGGVVQMGNRESHAKEAWSVVYDVPNEKPIQQ